MTDIAMIEAARARLDGHIRRTPTFLSLSRRDRRPADFRQAEYLQSMRDRSSSAGHGRQSPGLSPDARAKGVIAFSSGNHAQGVALAARLHGIPAVIIMPSDAPRIKIEHPCLWGRGRSFRSPDSRSRCDRRAAIGRARSYADQTVR